MRESSFRKFPYITITNKNSEYVLRCSSILTRAKESSPQEPARFFYLTQANVS